MKKLLMLLLAVPAIAFGAGAKVALDRAPIDVNDKASLQRGAQTFVNHCLNCHGATAMRYGRLTEIGLDEAQIRDNLLFTGEKVGDAMSSAMAPAVAKSAFGIVPPDLSLIGRSRSPDWLYTYMRSFYRDPGAKSGWNNSVFPNVAMPHVLWSQQGDQVLVVTQRQDPSTGDTHETRRLALERPGAMTAVEYDRYVADLVNFLAYVAEPNQPKRHFWGVIVLFFLAVFIVLTLLLKQEYWKDVR
jgi:ubiquinol-cytochrome c reductase cytochrome c1 subunit